MKTLIQLTFCLMAIFLTNIINAQIFEDNWDDGKSFADKAVKMADNSGFIVRTSNGTLEKWNNDRNVVWSYDPYSNLGQYTSSAGIEFLVLENGYIFVSSFNFECDFWTGSQAAILDKNGNEMWSKPLSDIGEEGMADIVQINENQILGLGIDSTWIMNLDGNYTVNLIDPDLKTGWQQDRFMWTQNGIHYSALEEKLFKVNDDGTSFIVMTFDTPIEFVVSGNGNSTYLFFEDKIVHMDLFRFTSQEYLIPTEHEIIEGEFENDQLYVFGKNGKQRLLGVLSNDLQTHNFIDWGNDFLVQTEIMVLDSTLVITGYEKGSKATPFEKSFSKTGFDHITHEIDLSLAETKYDDVYGQLETFITPDSNVLKKATWIITNLEATVQNVGNDTIKKFRLNFFKPFIEGCIVDPIQTRTYNTVLAPGEERTVFWGTYVDSNSFASALPRSVNICFWVSTPNEKLDNVNENDRSCMRVDIRDATSTKNILESNLISLYPNPTSDVLNIELKENSFSKKKIKIHNISGQIVFEKEWEDGQQKQQVEVSAFPAGVYFLSVKTNEGMIIKKWIKAE